MTGDDLAELRLRLRRTQAEMAEMLKVHRRTYENWEYGVSPVPAHVETVVLYRGNVCPRREAEKALGRIFLD